MFFFAFCASANTFTESSAASTTDAAPQADAPDVPYRNNANIQRKREPNPKIQGNKKWPQVLLIQKKALPLHRI